MIPCSTMKTVKRNHTILVEAATTSTDAVLNVDYVNQSNPIENSRLAEGVRTFNHRMIFDELGWHSVLVTAVRATQEEADELQVRLTDEVQNQQLYSGTSKFNHEVAALMACLLPVS